MYPSKNYLLAERKTSVLDTRQLPSCSRGRSTCPSATRPRSCWDVGVKISETEHKKPILVQVGRDTWGDKMARRAGDQGHT